MSASSVVYIKFTLGLHFACLRFAVVPFMRTMDHANEGNSTERRSLLNLSKEKPRNNPKLVICIISNQNTSNLQSRSPSKLGEATYFLHKPPSLVIPTETAVVSQVTRPEYVCFEEVSLLR